MTDTVPAPLPPAPPRKPATTTDVGRALPRFGARWIALFAATLIAIYLCWLIVAQFIEVLLWAAVLALEESANLVKEIAPQFSEETAARLFAQGDKRLKQAADIRALLQDLEPFQTE